MAKKPSFEQSLNRLEEVVERLETGDLPLEEAMKSFEEGVRLAGVCRSALQQVELQVEKLTRSGKELTLEPLGGEGDHGDA